MQKYAMPMFEKLFGFDIDCELFTRMIHNMLDAAKRQIPDLDVDMKFLCTLLHSTGLRLILVIDFAKARKFGFVYKFMTEKEKGELKELLTELDKTMGEDAKEQRDFIRGKLE